MKRILNYLLAVVCIGLFASAGYASPELCDIKNSVEVVATDFQTVDCNEPVAICDIHVRTEEGLCSGINDVSCLVTIIPNDVEEQPIDSNAEREPNRREDEANISDGIFREQLRFYPQLE